MTDTSSNTPDVPAILGGAPVRLEGPPDWPPVDSAVNAALEQMMRDGSWGKYHGRYCDELREKLADDHHCEHCVLCSSGTVAIELALRGLKVGDGDGDEVILAAYDFKGNFSNVQTVGATPVLVDVRPDDWNLAVDNLEAAITPRTKAIVVSHLHGGVVDMPRVMQIARSKEIAVIEDACQMPGATVYGRKAGTWGDVGVHSFGGSKLLSAGRGGAFFTNNAEIVQRARLYSHRGNEAYPLSELQAAVLIPQLEQLDARNTLRENNVAALCQQLENYRGLKPFEICRDNCHPGFYKLGFQYAADAFAGLSRDLFATAMRAEGIALHPGFRSLHQTHSARRFRKVGDLSNATHADACVLVLHHPVLLGDSQDVGQIVAAVDKIQQSAMLIRDAKH